MVHKSLIVSYLTVLTAVFHILCGADECTLQINVFYIQEIYLNFVPLMKIGVLATLSDLILSVSHS